MRDNAGLFGLPQSLLDAVKEVQEGSAEYQNKVKAHMAKKGIKSLGDLSPEEKKKFFSDLDAMHKAKNEAVTDYNPKSQGGTRKELLAKFAETGNSKDAEAARKAGASHDELKKAAANAMKRGKGDKGKNYMMSKNEEVEIEESDLPSTKEKQKTVMVVHKTSGKELKIQASALDKYKAMGYKLMEETEIEEAKKEEKCDDCEKPMSKCECDDEEDKKEIEEAKSGTGYQLYHKDFSSAMAHAYDFAKQKYGMEIDPLEIDRNVAMGPKKPSSGKSNAYRLLDKTGKKAIQVQVANLDNKRYELNMYKEDVDIEEAESHQAKTTMKHISKPTAGEKKAAKDIKPGIAGYRDRIAMLKSAKARGALKEEDVEEARIKGKGYDNPENERKAPEGKVPFTSFQQGKQGDQAARLHATSAKGKLVKGKAQSAPQKESYELTPEDIEFINSLNEKQ